MTSHAESAPAACPHGHQVYEHNSRTWTCQTCGATSVGVSLIGVVEGDPAGSDEKQAS